MAGVRLAGREAGEPDAGVEERLEVHKCAVLVGIDDEGIRVYAFGFHVDGDGADCRDTDKEVRPLDLAPQRLRNRHGRLLDVDVGQGAAIEPGTESVFGSLSLGAALSDGQCHRGAGLRRGAAFAPVVGR